MPLLVGVLFIAGDAAGALTGVFTGAGTAGAGTEGTGAMGLGAIGDDAVGLGAVERFVGGGVSRSYHYQYHYPDLFYMEGNSSDDRLSTITTTTSGLFWTLTLPLRITTTATSTNTSHSTTWFVT